MLPRAVLAPAKLNLRLKIEGLRPDNYHLLSMVNLTCDLCDYIKLEFNDAPHFTVTLQPDSYGLLPWIVDRRDSIKDEFEDASRNLATRAAKILFEFLELKGGLNIKISKGIPFGAGLGGGSSDAAAVLRAITQYYLSKNENISTDKTTYVINAVYKAAEIVGADVRYLIRGGLAHVSGIGEIIKNFVSPELNRLGLILVLPHIGTSTSEVFSYSRKKLEGSKIIPDKYLNEWFEKHSLFNNDSKLANPLSYSDLINIIDNDLEPAACEVLPLLGDIFTRLRGIDGIKVSLSGSGSTIMVFSTTSWSPEKRVYQTVMQVLSDLPVDLRMIRSYYI